MGRRGSQAKSSESQEVHLCDALCTMHRQYCTYHGVPRTFAAALSVRRLVAYAGLAPSTRSASGLRIVSEEVVHLMGSWIVSAGWRVKAAIVVICAQAHMATYDNAESPHGTPWQPEPGSITMMRLATSGRCMHIADHWPLRQIFPPLSWRCAN